MNKLLAAAAFVLVAMPVSAEEAAKPAAPVAPPVVAEAAVPAAERTKIEIVVRDLLQREPNLVMEAAQKFQAQEQERAQQAAVAGIKQNADKLIKDPNSPATGNAKGDVTVVEFFDYNCGYCKRAHPTIAQLKKDDANVRIVHKQFPILGPTSLTAAQAAVAAHLQGKFVEMHDALMANKEPLSDAVITKMAGTIKGLDAAKLKTDMAGAEVKKRIDADLDLGKMVGVQGTPGFIINEKLYPGAMDVDAFKKIIAEARAAAPAKK